MARPEGKPMAEPRTLLGRQTASSGGPTNIESDTSNFENPGAKIGKDAGSPCGGECRRVIEANNKAYGHLPRRMVYLATHNTEVTPFLLRLLVEHPMTELEDRSNHLPYPPHIPVEKKNHEEMCAYPLEYVQVDGKMIQVRAGHPGFCADKKICQAVKPATVSIIEQTTERAG